MVQQQNNTIHDMKWNAMQCDKKFSIQVCKDAMAAGFHHLYGRVFFSRTYLYLWVYYILELRILTINLAINR